MSEDKKLPPVTGYTRINPHTVYNGFHSSQRNMHSTASVAFAMATLAQKVFKKNKTVQTTLIALSIAILIASVAYGAMSWLDFYYFINYAEDKLPEVIPIEQWKRYLYVAPITTAILLVGFFAFLYFILKK